MFYPALLQLEVEPVTSLLCIQCAAHHSMIDIDCEIYRTVEFGRINCIC